jgi:ABC-2 type transport system ATP-binding protein
LKREGKTVLFSTHILTDAEMLCDKVGVIVGGKLQGIGRPDEIVGMKVQEMEILFDADANDPRSAAMRARATESGSRYAMRVPEENVFAALEELRAAGARLAAVTPIKPTLEEYFLHLVEKDRVQASAIEVSGK